MTLEIKSRWTDEIIYIHPCESLVGQSLFGQDLAYADFSGIDVTNTDFTCANLNWTKISYEQLMSANLKKIKEDLFEILMWAKDEVPFLRSALIQGKIDGQLYYGDCVCLIGTIAKAKHRDVYEIPGIDPDGTRPAERWFLGIDAGDDPDTNVISRITLEWIDEFLEMHK